MAHDELGLSHASLMFCASDAHMMLAGDMSTFLILRRSAMKLAESNDTLKAQIGHPYSLGRNESEGFYQG